MVEIRKPGLLADAIDVDLERFRQAGRLMTLPAALADLADALERVAGMLRDAEQRDQAVDLGDDVLRLIQQFHGVLRTLGGAPAQA